jgi:hypothetical protein
LGARYRDPAKLSGRDGLLLLKYNAFSALATLQGFALGLCFVPILRHFPSAFAAGPASENCEVAVYLFSRSLLPAQPHNFLKIPARHNLLPSEGSRTERRTVGRIRLPELVLLFVGAFFYFLATCFARKKRNRATIFAINLLLG